MARDPAALVAQLETLNSLLVDLPPGPPIEGTADGLRARQRLADQIEDYILPRLRNLDAPLLVGIGGSTGAGKSTITNSLIGHNVSAAGLLRPTTRMPVLVCHPDDERWFAEGEVLPDVMRSTGSGIDPNALAIHTSLRMHPGLAILDTPDIDSVEVANHELAAQLLGAADLWLFVTTAARYADAVPWDYLRTARERSTGLAVVINRMPPDAAGPVADHFAAMLSEQGLADTPLFTIDEVDLADGQLTEAQLGALRSWIDGIAADAERRDALVRSTIDGAIASIPGRAERIAVAVDRQAATIRALGTIADQRFAEALQRVERRLEGGNLLRSEVLTSWQDFVGTGQLMQSLQAGVSRLRDRLKSVFTGEPTATIEMQGEVQSSLAAAITEAADAAADATVEAWDRAPAGHMVLGDDAWSMARVGTDLPARIDAEIVQWQDYVLGLVRQQAEGKRLAARTISLGINTIGVTLMVVIFAQTGGITGGEVAVAGGTATLSQALLTAIFGENAVRDLARQSREDLVARVERLFAEEAGRFHDRLAGMPSIEHADALRQTAGTVVEAAR
ncbi:MAG TPA: ABC transporter [Acidimicrobiia bacterium]|jgi:hypothetical protein|nr:ABC transporter [Acidimicrobiia bacterium]